MFNKKSLNSATIHGDGCCFQFSDLMMNPLTWERYEKKWTALLKMEKLQAEINIQYYNMTGVTMSTLRENKRLLVLEVS